MARCRYCKAAIKWIRTTADKRMPCEPNPVTVVLEGSGERMTVVTLEGQTISGRAPTGPTSLADADAVTGYVPHWGNCPKVTKSRTSQRKRRQRGRKSETEPPEPAQRSLF